MDHRLLIAGLVVWQVLAVLVESLADTGDDAMPEDAEHSRDEAALVAISLAVLHLQEAHDGLCGCQSDLLV